MTDAPVAEVEKNQIFRMVRISGADFDTRFLAGKGRPQFVDTAYRKRNAVAVASSKRVAPRTGDTIEYSSSIPHRGCPMKSFLCGLSEMLWVCRGRCAIACACRNDWLHQG